MKRWHVSSGRRNRTRHTEQITSTCTRLTRNTGKTPDGDCHYQIHLHSLEAVPSSSSVVPISSSHILHVKFIADICRAPSLVDHQRFDSQRRGEQARTWRTPYCALAHTETSSMLTCKHWEDNKNKEVLNHTRFHSSSSEPPISVSYGVALEELPTVSCSST